MLSVISFVIRVGVIFGVVFDNVNRNSRCFLKGVA